MTYKIPVQPENSFRITLELETPAVRLDNALFDALKKQNENESLSRISKGNLKKLFTEKKVLIKGQIAKAKSSINSGITYIDILL
ncbi:MAG: hypothetical protein DRQ88_04850 [Epsilonproteobacteria bacterium]|nr:MAG: hypothetical protein DRQ88_04850 [Campylobacterota bacterium]